MKFILSVTKTRAFPFLFLLIGFIHGFLYVFLMPPWQHYDEPAHFEYAWMIANSPSFPQKGMYDNSIRLKILQSMREHNFFDSPSLKELDTVAATLDPVWIGISQVGDPPLYYLLVSLPLRLLKNSPVEVQLYATRLVSLTLWLGVLFLAWLFAKEITPENHPLRWMLPLTLALLPAFANHSSALNNDIAATFIYSLIILFGTRLIKNGFKAFTVIILLVLMAMSYFTKASIWLSVLVIPLAFLFALIRNRPSWIGIAILCLAGLLAIFIFFEFNDVAYWYRNTSQPQPTRENTPFGPAIQIVDENIGRSNALMQEVFSPTPDRLVDKLVTVGVWMWGEGNLPAYPPSIMIVNKYFGHEFLRPEAVHLSSTPTYQTFVYYIPETYIHLYYVIEPFISNDGTGTVFFQNPVLIEGNLSGDALSLLEDRNKQAEWSDQRIGNLLRNSDASAVWPKFRSNIIDLMYKVDYRIGDAANSVIYTLDFKANFGYTRNSAANIFRSFWGRFGWGQIQWVGNKPFVLPLLFTLIGLVPGFYGLVKGFPNIKVLLLIWFGFALLGVFFYAWFTGISAGGLIDRPVLPEARFIFPTMLILMGIIVSGWEVILSKIPTRLRKYAFITYFLFFVYLDLLSIYSIFNFYRISS